MGANNNVNTTFSEADHLAVTAFITRWSGTTASALSAVNGSL
jgi:hypothetical protein